MKNNLKILINVFNQFGIDLRKMFYSFKALPFFFVDYYIFKKLARNKKAEFPLGIVYPCLSDKLMPSGIASGHYFNQDLLIARKIFIANPEIHVDVGSRIDGFVAHIASFREIEVFDIRNLSNSIPNIKFSKADLMSEIPDTLFNYCDSISCLHVIEHFGLGRYGDPLCWDGYKKGIDNLLKILKNGGTLYLSVPIGTQRIEYNAHRVFSVKFMLNLFKDNGLNLMTFSYVDDSGNLHEDIELSEDEIENNFSCFFGCGIFELKKCNK